MPAGADSADPEKGSMVEARQTRSPLLRVWTLATVAVVALSAAGCTMCPDPFDYSGPVPNGSAPQNDFRARSGGILPLGAAPTPWPLLVEGEGQSDEPEPMPTETAEIVSGVVEQEKLQKTVAVLGESEPEAEGHAVVPSVASPAASVTTIQPQREPVMAASKVSLLPAGETPGWRARRR
jgi:hypothetical protein